jgi:hypothetical protein
VKAGPGWPQFIDLERETRWALRMERVLPANNVSWITNDIKNDKAFTCGMRAVYWR